jgi:hypothetical protein
VFGLLWELACAGCGAETLIKILLDVKTLDVFVFPGFDEYGFISTIIKLLFG